MRRARLISVVAALLIAGCVAVPEPATTPATTTDPVATSAPITGTTPNPTPTDAPGATPVPVPTDRPASTPAATPASTSSPLPTANPESTVEPTAAPVAADTLVVDWQRRSGAPDNARIALRFDQTRFEALVAAALAAGA